VWLGTAARGKIALRAEPSEQTADFTGEPDRIISIDGHTRDNIRLHHLASERERGRLPDHDGIGRPYDSTQFLGILRDEVPVASPVLGRHFSADQSARAVRDSTAALPDATLD